MSAFTLQEVLKHLDTDGRDRERRNISAAFAGALKSADVARFKFKIIVECDDFANAMESLPPRGTGRVGRPAGTSPKAGSSDYIRDFRHENANGKLSCMPDDRALLTFDYVVEFLMMLGMPLATGEVVQGDFHIKFGPEVYRKPDGSIYRREGQKVYRASDVAAWQRKRISTRPMTNREKLAEQWRIAGEDAASAVRAA